VDDEVDRARVSLRDERPLGAGREARAPQTPEVRPLHGVGDRGRLQGEGLGPRGVAARLPVRRERVRVGPPEVAGEDRLGRRRRRLAHRTRLELSTRSASGPGDNQAVGPLRQPSKRRWGWTGRLPRSQAGRRTVNLEPQGQALGLKHGLLSLKAPDFSPGDVYRSWSISRSTVSGVRLPSYRSSTCSIGAISQAQRHSTASSVTRPSSVVPPGSMPSRRLRWSRIAGAPARWQDRLWQTETTWRPFGSRKYIV